MDTRGTILVAGATGHQGGAVARHLLADGWTVLAMTRDAESAAARALAELGARVVVADMLDAASLDAAMDGVDGVFSVQTWRGPGGIDAEMRAGLAMADAAARAGVTHFTYSSVGGADRATGIPHFESKWRIEEHIRELGLPATIWRPVSFMENYDFQRAGIEAGSLRVSVPAGVSLQLIAVDDIGGFVALGYREPERFVGTATEIAGDELTGEQAARVFSEALGHPVTLVEPDFEHLDAEAGAMLHWFSESGYKADIPALRELRPGLLTLPEWVAGAGWAQG